MRGVAVFLLRKCRTPLYIRGMKKTKFGETLPPVRVSKRMRAWVAKEAQRACEGNECALIRELIEAEISRQRHSDKKRSL